jgi:hypothetical protein
MSGSKKMSDPFSNEVLQYLDHPSDAWDSRESKKTLRKEWSEWLSKKNWCVFLTLTFREETYPEIALKLFKFLVRKLNEEVYGPHYTNYVGHSYFSYVVGIEYQIRGTIHFHALTDRPVNFVLIRRLWNAWAGFAKPEIIKHNENAVYYVTKYAAKCGQMEPPFFAEKEHTPLLLPPWWKEQVDEVSETNDQINTLL